MDAFGEAIRPFFGGWTAAVVVMVAVVLWAARTIPGWFASRPGAPRGSLSSARYWRARLAEALSQSKDAPDGPERTRFAARVTEARLRVEAHEAKRRVGFGGVAPLWVIVWLLVILASIAGSAPGVWSSPGPTLLALALFMLTFGVELLALHAATVRDDHVNALVAAGRFGHSELVRDDPWLVLRVYDRWRSSGREVSAARKRERPRRKDLDRGTRFETRLIGLASWPTGVSVDRDIWLEAGAQTRPDPANCGIDDDAFEASDSHEHAPSDPFRPNLQDVTI